MRELRAGDVDRDGDADIVVGSGTVHVLRSTGAGTVSSTLAVGGFARWFELADLNRDGSLDVLVAHDGRVTAFDGDGAGGFSPRPAGDGDIYQFALGDLNHDGRLDLATEHWADTFPAIGVMLGDVDGTFGSVRDYPVVLEI